jgi:hypothetical protein
MKTMKRAVFWVLFLSLAPASWGLTLWGVDINGLEIESSIFTIVNSVGDSAPDPIVNTVGLSVPFRFMGHFLFRPEAQLFFLSYAYQDGRAVPEDSMFDNVVVMSIMLNPTFGYEFPINPTLSWSAEGGLGFLLRFPVFLNGTTAGDMALPVTGWLLAGRLFYPDVGSGITWQFSPLFALTLRAQLFFPIFNLWNDLPWYDELTYGAGLGVRFTF